ncbi:hypothetical protein CVT25_003432 [Psilocybe cyanescens]|uniref:Threonylcarbamoyl-AMP synthase n=1 Tax=Psilocybe cyanescens TaxID=93625 RepID=A0A409WMB0_PSICY|nr:hypothetical protein CVT25_003432 [Psilocybe cyanescens]
MLRDRATLYRGLLRELRQSVRIKPPRKVNKNIIVHFRSIAEKLNDDNVRARQDYENAIQFIRAQREHKRLLERIPPKWFHVQTCSLILLKDTYHDETSQPQASPLPSRKSSEIYYRHLTTKKRGSPLWIPEPNNMLSVEYQKQGIGIGDVGIITDYGAFDYLFNICVPQTDPINPEDMPENFSPLNPPLSCADVLGYSASKADSHLASAQVETFRQDGESSGLTFESSASEGAILTMPRGSNSKDLRNLFKFRRYALANAEKWYRYANEIRGREARNGDVRLVVGYDSTTAWGMATFANLSEQRYSRLKFKPIGENSLGRIYGWEYSGISMAEVRSGPDIHELERLMNLDQAEGQLIYENQCLFVRTLNITLQNDIWNKLAEEWEAFYLGDESQMSDQDFGPSPTPRNFSFGPTGAGLSGEGAASDTCMKEDPGMTTVFQGTLQLNAAHISHLPLALDIHPSEVINRFLLSEKPNAKVAITEDNDWISVLKKDDNVLPPPEILLDRIKMMYDLCEEEDMVFLQLKTLKMQTEGHESTHIDLGFQLHVPSRPTEAYERNVDHESEDESSIASGVTAANHWGHCNHPTVASASGTLPLSTLIPFNVPFPQEHPLGSTYNASGLTILSAPDAMRVFRSCFNWLPASKPKKNGNCEIFKSGIPMWKYSVNDQGGQWILTLRTSPTRRGERSTLLALAITGEEVDGGTLGLKQSTKKRRASEGNITFLPSSDEPQITSEETLEALKIASHRLVDLAQTVVFPTETVYGLGALALDATAAAKIFATKGRPPDNPLIVHVSSFNMLRSLLPPGYIIPKAYEALMKHFWPGALTLLFPRNPDIIPTIITAGQSSVAIRMPSHPVARALIATARAPLAAPSANTSGKPSPTRLDHVHRDLDGKVSLILDGGACGVGLESTVVDGLHADGNIRVLRPGGITVEDLQRVLREEFHDIANKPKVLVHKRDYADEQLESAPTTPGMKYRHYSPSVPVTLLLTLPSLSGSQPAVKFSDYIFSLQKQQVNTENLKIGILAPTDSNLWNEIETINDVEWFRFPLGRLAEPSVIAQNLFDGLLSLERDGVHLMLIEEVVEEREGLAIMNRVQKAASDSIRIAMS